MSGAEPVPKAARLGSPAARHHPRGRGIVFGLESQRRAQRAGRRATTGSPIQAPGMRRAESAHRRAAPGLSRPGPAGPMAGAERAPLLGGGKPPQARRRSPTARQPCCGWTKPWHAGLTRRPGSSPRVGAEHTAPGRPVQSAAKVLERPGERSATSTSRDQRAFASWCCPGRGCTSPAMDRVSVQRRERRCGHRWAAPAAADHHRLHNRSAPTRILALITMCAGGAVPPAPSSSGFNLAAAGHRAA